MAGMKPHVTRRAFLRSAAGTSLAALLAACGASTGGGGATPAGNSTAAPEGTKAPEAQAPTPTTAAAAEPTPTVGIDSFGQGAKTTVFWHGLGGADGKTMVEMLKQYAQAKTDTTVRSETYGWDVFYQKLPTAAVAGTPPDMAIMHEWAIQQFASQGLLQPVDEIFFGPGLLPKDDFNPNLLKTVTVDGKLMGIPFDNHGWGLYYNTKLIQDAGLDPNNMPKNGAEFLTWADKLTVDENGKHPSESGFNADKVKVWATHASW